ncbi:MAG: NAD(P)-dependent oxidoreductase [Candidatus Saccharimonadales bacterium]
MANVCFYDATADDEKFFRQTLSDQSLTFVPQTLSQQTVVPSADILSVFVSSNVPAEVIGQFPKLRLIATRSTGYDHIDQAAASQRDITISTVPSYGEHTVAEYTFGMLLSLTRKLPWAFEAAHEGNRSHRELEGMDLFGKTFGVIGAGRIGQSSARIAKGFGMNVVAFDPFPKPEAASQIGFIYKTLEEVLATADVISLHVPFTPENRHLINAERLGKMKPSAILINTARGELVDTAALVDVVSSGHLGGVALDVIENEQLISPLDELALLRSEQVDKNLLIHSVEIDVLKGQPNVLITSHNAFNTAEALQRINQTTADNIRAFLNGQPQNLAK